MSENFPVFKDTRGTLVPIEFNNLPFKPKRIFYVRDVPKGDCRGNHAHFTTKQILVCLQGEINVKLDTIDIEWEITLEPNESVFVDKLVWDSQVYMTGDDILMSICSTPHDDSDYIKDFEEFRKIRKNYEQYK